MKFRQLLTLYKTLLLEYFTVNNHIYGRCFDFAKWRYMEVFQHFSYFQSYVTLTHLMASTDLDTVSPGLSPACYFCGFIVTLDKFLYSTWLCIFPNNGLAWVSSTWNELDMTMNKHYSRSSSNCLLSSRGYYRLYRSCQRVMLCRGRVKSWEEFYFVCKTIDLYLWFFFWKYFFLTVKR